MKNKILEIWEIIKAFYLPKISRIIDWSKSITLPGFSGVPLYDTLVFIYYEMTRDNITTRANSVAYSLFIAVFPFIIFLFTLLPYIPISADYLNLLSEAIHNALPSDAAQYLMEIIIRLVSVERTDLQFFGVLTTIFFASNGVLTLMHGFDKAYEEQFKDRGFFRMRFVAIALTLTLSVLFAISFVLLVLGNVILEKLTDYIYIETWMYILIRIFKYLFAIFLLYVGIGTMYKFGSTLKKRLRFFNTGATVATVLSVLISLGFSYYVNNFGRYNDFYGSIGALIVVLLWLQFNAMAILIGFEFNASIVMNKGYAISDLIKKDD